MDAAKRWVDGALDGRGDALHRTAASPACSANLISGSTSEGIDTSAANAPKRRCAAGGSNGAPYEKGPGRGPLFCLLGYEPL